MLIDTPQIPLRTLKSPGILYPLSNLCPRVFMLPNFPYIKMTYTSETYWDFMFVVCWEDSFTVFIVQFWLVHKWLIFFKMESFAVGKWKCVHQWLPLPWDSHMSILLIATSQKLHSYQDWKINLTCCGHHAFFLLQQKTKQNKKISPEF